MSNNQQNENLKALPIKELFQSGNYIVPIYQRNYAWGNSEINQLIDDIEDYRKENKEKNYYIGTLVVHKKGDNYEVIDGQQRLTTLFILISVLKNKLSKSFKNINFSLKFESREKSQKALKEIFESKISPKDDLNTSIMNGYEIIEKRLSKLEDLGAFFDYLCLKVQILRVEVPQDTDLNHYFEIMNNRGEQLEKHEILKSKMLNILKKDKEDTKLFNTIWEACANMDNYVQYGFSVEERKTIFGDNWNEFKATDFSYLQNGNQTTEDSKQNIKDALEINKINNWSKIDNPFEDKKTVNTDTPERFNSVINFPNFLLHVLKIQESSKEGFDDKTVPLDDKKLLETFEGRCKTADDVKKFAYNLLKAKFLFDNYIIKREYTNKGDEWSLKQLIINDNKGSKNNTAYYKNRFDEADKNEKILMLLSMFHVSAPTIIYKHWLNASLKFLFEQTQPILADSYIEYLEKLAKAYMKDRFLSENPKDYHEIIYTNSEESQNNKLNWCKLDQGTAVENFIFNYLDYLLWKDEKINAKYKINFSFAFRSSVEHYYPQNPMENIAPLGETTLNCFGNLCLVTNSENSRLSNFTPKAKKEFYSKQQNQSIKQRIMMGEPDDEWNDEAIKKHNQEMCDILSEALTSM
jgi:uncharacterized protein with ParB-like and HNH nuclease domain